MKNSRVTGIAGRKVLVVRRTLQGIIGDVHSHTAPNRHRQEKREKREPITFFSRFSSFSCLDERSQRDSGCRLKGARCSSNASRTTINDVHCHTAPNRHRQEKREKREL